MNKIDKNFNNLINEIKNKSLEEIFHHIKNNYLNINNELKDNIETFLNNFNYWGKLNRNEGIFEELYNRSLSLKENIDDYIWLYNKLEDYKSKKVLLAILNNWYNFDFNLLKEVKETNYNHYFDLDIIKTNNEVIADLGAYTGDTILDYFNNYGLNYKNIYCFEITDNTFEILKNNLNHYKNINFIKKAISDKKETLFLNENSTSASANTLGTENTNIKVEATTLDEEIKEKITLIKMDIEGYEKKALLGSQNHIKNDHPKLLISVYHNHNDLWEIPMMVKNMDSSYKLYLRYYGGNIFPTEIVLLAI